MAAGCTWVDLGAVEDIHKGPAYTSQGLELGKIVLAHAKRSLVSDLVSARHPRPATYA